MVVIKFDWILWCSRICTLHNVYVKCIPITYVYKIWCATRMLILNAICIQCKLMALRHCSYCVVGTLFSILWGYNKEHIFMFNSIRLSALLCHNIISSKLYEEDGKEYKRSQFSSFDGIRPIWFLCSSFYFQTKKRRKEADVLLLT